MEACYAAFDLYVLASYREGFPRSAMEAAAMGLPVVATNIRGCRQVVDDGRTGRLVPVRDAAAIADAVVEIASDDELRHKMGLAAREKAHRRLRRAALHRSHARRVRRAARAHDARRRPRERRDRRLPAPSASRAVDDAWRLADLHARRINEGFLASLGPAFLGRLYRRVVRSPRAFAVVGVEDGPDRRVLRGAPRTSAGCTASSSSATAGRRGHVGARRSCVRCRTSSRRCAIPSTTGDFPTPRSSRPSPTSTPRARVGVRSSCTNRCAELERRGCAAAKVVDRGDERTRAAALRALRLRAAPAVLAPRRHPFGSPGMGLVVAFGVHRRRARAHARRGATSSFGARRARSPGPAQGPARAGARISAAPRCSLRWASCSPSTQPMWLVPLGLAVALGVADDIRTISPSVRLAVQIVDRCRRRDRRSDAGPVRAASARPRSWSCS